MSSPKELPDSQSRLAALKARRARIEEGTKSEAESSAPEAASDDEPAPRRARPGGMFGMPRARQRLIRGVVNILTRTADDGEGMVPDTPFTKAGVRSLMDLLRQRAENEGAPGARIAERAITFLTTPEEGKEDAETIHGVSLARLQLLGRLVDRARNRDNRDM